MSLKNKGKYMDKTKLILSILAATILAGWGVRWVMNRSGNSLTKLTSLTSQNKQDSRVNLVSPQEFASLAKEKNAFIVDVHTPEQTHIPGTNAVIPYDKIATNIYQLPADKSTPILVYCRSGSMSGKASAEIAALGYSNVYDLDGGANAYKESNVSVSLSPATHPLGTVVYGDVATTTFTLTNYSPLPLKITRVSTSCGCTKAEVEKDELAGYESTTVNVSFDPAVHKDDTDLGDLSRTIYIETDNPNFPNLESTITATVIKK
ncbi:MAG: hypothetical protein COY80_03425 [Candidatus Pacebacteria bacterium CG_4_10_14_0_8_um_filter_42_14]|nr:MAG: hypothetical protein COY80_03425 [Candidatus Pacebacteria bacterium CG_4_10_14_0_8_um_filter_42_14]